MARPESALFAPATPPASPPVTAPEPVNPGDLRVGRVSVAGNVTSDSSRILRTFEVPSGSHFSEDMVRRGIRKLFALGVFSDVYVEPQQHGQTMDLVIHVRERPRIGRIDYHGNHKKDAGDVGKHVGIHVGEPYQPTAVQATIDSLLKMYRDDGYSRAEIEAHADSVAGKNEVTIVFEIKEGEKVKVERVVFEGVHAVPEDKLRKAMKTKAHGAFGGGQIKDENLDEDVAAVEGYYHDHGYRDARVVSHDFGNGSRPDRLIYKITVDEGRRYQWGDVRWSGNESVSLATLERAWRQRGWNPIYDQSRVERTQAAAYAEYSERGFLFLSIDPRETVRDSSAIVDLTFVITEGSPSIVRYVNVTGNKGTREHVIRREISLHEGDRFKRSALVRTQGDIMRLGLFEDVQIDFTPAESTDVDVNLKVKEKQVGTASAGAGYTSQSGITGFLELGHNNVLGNGQSLNLHLERGGKRSNYNLSFTEPWFRGTPTLLGYSLYSTYNELDLYNERRTGASVRVGRPLPWPDYSHGSIGYQLENVRITPIAPVLSLADSARLAGIQLGAPELTSSVTLNFSRNTADNPFYPKKGTRLQAESEIAGGPFGGAVNFNKNRFEGRLYMPSLVRRVTTMLKARWGILTPYLDQNLPVPEYERFRLGGGTTVDPLRGYGDYEVVPEKFMHAVRDTTHIHRLGSAGQDTVVAVDNGWVPIRYPGGRFFSVYTIEQQFAIVHPLHGLFFMDAGNTWDLGRDVKPLQLKYSAGVGIRFEVPMLGNIGFDYAYGFDQERFNPNTGYYYKHPGWRGHFLIGNVNF